MTVSIREWIWREHWWKEQLLFLAGKSHMSPTAVCLWGGQWRLFIPGHRSLCFYTSVFLFISCHSALQGGYKHKQSTGTAEVFADVRFRHNWFSVQNLRKYVHSINITCKCAALIQSQCLKAWKTFPETHTAIRTCRLLPPLRNCHEECKRWGRNSISLVFNRSPFLSFFFSTAFPHWAAVEERWPKEGNLYRQNWVCSHTGSFTRPDFGTEVLWAKHLHFILWSADVELVIITGMLACYNFSVLNTKTADGNVIILSCLFIK